MTFIKYESFAATHPNAPRKITNYSAWLGKACNEAHGILSYDTFVNTTFGRSLLQRRLDERMSGMEPIGEGEEDEGQRDDGGRAKGKGKGKAKGDDEDRPWRSGGGGGSSWSSWQRGQGQY